MVPPVPLNSSVAPMSSGATWCTERSKNERRRRGGEGMTQITQSTHACESEHRAATYTPLIPAKAGIQLGLGAGPPLSRGGAVVVIDRRKTFCSGSGTSPLTIFVRYIFLAPSRLDTEGRLISV